MLCIMNIQGLKCHRSTLGPPESIQECAAGQDTCIKDYSLAAYSLANRECGIKGECKTRIEKGLGLADCKECYTDLCNFAVPKSIIISIFVGFFYMI
uniref:DUF753 domain-containing protein n=1 Tax=Panagrolaimus sp. JU765 TaxID=591449 RepID=A0AC34Q1Y4_9BILA